MRSPARSRSTRLFGPSEMFLSHDGSCYCAHRTNRMGLTPPAQVMWASRQIGTLAALCRITGKFLCLLIGVQYGYTLTVDEAMSWTSQLS